MIKFSSYYLTYHWEPICKRPFDGYDQDTMLSSKAIWPTAMTSQSRKSSKIPAYANGQFNRQLRHYVIKTRTSWEVTRHFLKTVRTDGGRELPIPSQRDPARMGGEVWGYERSAWDSQRYVVWCVLCRRISQEPGSSKVKSVIMQLHWRILKMFITPNRGIQIQAVLVTKHRNMNFDISATKDALKDVLIIQISVAAPCLFLWTPWSWHRASDSWISIDGNPRIPPPSLRQQDPGSQIHLARRPWWLQSRHIVICWFLVRHPGFNSPQYNPLIVLYGRFGIRKKASTENLPWALSIDLNYIARNPQPL